MTFILLSSYWHFKLRVYLLIIVYSFLTSYSPSIRSNSLDYLFNISNYLLEKYLFNSYIYFSNIYNISVKALCITIVMCIIFIFLYLYTLLSNFFISLTFITLQDYVWVLIFRWYRFFYLLLFSLVSLINLNLLLFYFLSCRLFFAYCLFCIDSIFNGLNRSTTGFRNYAQ